MRHLRSRLKIQGMHPYPSSLRGGGVQNFRKVFAGEVRNFYFGGGVNFLGGGGLSRNLEVKIKTA